jgi:hypothetical protein
VILERVAESQHTQTISTTKAFGEKIPPIELIEIGLCGQLARLLKRARHMNALTTDTKRVLKNLREQITHETDGGASQTYYFMRGCL